MKSADLPALGRGLVLELVFLYVPLEIIHRASVNNVTGRFSVEQISDAAKRQRDRKWHLQGSKVMNGYREGSDHTSAPGLVSAG